MKRVVIVLAIVGVVGAVAGGWWYLQQHPEWVGRLQDELNQAVEELGLGQQEAPVGLIASGFVEADEVSVSTEIGGRIIALHADEGDEVSEGMILVELNDALLEAQIRVSEADLAAAEAGLAQVKAGVRAETLGHAKAVLSQAEVAREAAQIAWKDAQAMLENPQELQLALTTARAQLGVLDLQEKQVAALANSAQAARDFADEAVAILRDIEPRRAWVPIGSFPPSSLPPGVPLPPGLEDGEYRINGYKIVISGGTVSVETRVRIAVPADMMDSAIHQQASATYQSWLAWTGLDQAKTARSGAESYLKELERQKANPLTLQAQANAAKAQYEIATAAVGLAEAQVDGLKIGATPAQISAVEAQVEIARAALEALEVQVDKFDLRAPRSGLILERTVHVGEVALPGAPLMTIGDLDDVTLTVYVPEDQLGRVRVGQPVSVTVDAYPEREFDGQVTFIAGQAEFTPKNVQTREERVNMVFAVKVSLPNPDHALKPGMPADAVLVPAMAASE
jgi:HlyD family secretion protein